MPKEMQRVEDYVSLEDYNAAPYHYKESLINFVHALAKAPTITPEDMWEARVIKSRIQGVANLIKGRVWEAMTPKDE